MYQQKFKNNTIFFCHLSKSPYLCTHNEQNIYPKAVLLLGGSSGFVGSGIHSLNSQIKSKSLKKEFEKRTVKGTEVEDSSESSIFYFPPQHLPC